MSLSHHLAMECRIEQGRIQAIAAISQVLTYFISFRKTALPIAAYSRRGVAIFAIDFSGRPARKISKNHATANAFGCPDSSCFARFNPTRG